MSLGKAYEAYATVKSAIEVLRTKCLGGSSLVSLGNMFINDFIFRKFNDLGLNLKCEVNFVKNLMKVSEVPKSLLSPFTVKFIEVAEKMGLRPRLMPKCIDYTKCTSCGLCSRGCPNEAKYTALNLIEMCEKNGLKVITGFRVEKVALKGGLIEVEGKLNGVKSKVQCRALILAAVALETPRLLMQLCSIDGIGRNLFVDPFVTVGGPYNGASSIEGLQMAAYIDHHDFLIAPHFSGLLLTEFKVKGIDVSRKGIASLMVKIADEGGGRVHEDGSISAVMTEKDWRILRRGVEKAKEILIEMGVREKDIVVTKVRGAHPGGTAAIGRVVSRDLTINDCSSVFVADASLIPPPLGKPPILTIMSLALKVSSKVLECIRG